MRGHHLLIASAPPHGLCMVKVSLLYHASCHVPALLTHRVLVVMYPCHSMPHGTTSHVRVPVPTHTPSLVPGTACFLRYMTWSGRMFLAGSYRTDQTGRLSITRLVSNHPNHCR